MKALKIEKYYDKLAWLVILGFGVVFVWVSLVNHWRFLTFGWDLGFYDQAVYLVSRFRAPYSTFMDENFLAVRFAPIIFLLAPLYWVWPGAEVLLVAQAVLVALAGWPVYRLGEKLLKNKLVGLVGLVSYFSFIGLQRAVFFDFHPDTVMVFFISWLLLFLVEKEYRKVLICGFLMLLTKEWAGLVLVAMGMMVWLEGDSKKKLLGTRLLGLGAVGFAATLLLVIGFGGRDTPVFEYGSLGSTPVEVVVNSVKKPWLPLRLLVEPEIKRETVVGTLGSFGFLPLLSPISLLPVLAQIAVRFWDESHQQAWTLRFHYSAPLAPLLVYSTYLTIKRHKKYWRQLALFWFGVSLLSMYYFHAPVFTVLKPAFYSDNPRNKLIHEALGQIPDDEAVAAQNNLSPHLSARGKIFPLPEVGDAKYVLVDLAPGQSSYNFSTGSEDEIVKLVESLLASEDYLVAWQEDDIWLLKKSN